MAGLALGGDGEGFPVVLSGVSTEAGNTHFVRSWVPKDRQPVGAAEGCGPQVSREPSIPPSVGTFSELTNLAVAERPCLWGQGLYRSTPLLRNLRVCAVLPSSLVSAEVQGTEH